MATILAIDASSTSSGVAIIRGGKILKATHYKPNTKLSAGHRLRFFSEFLDKFKGRYKIDAVAVEDLAVNRNFKTVKILSWYQAIGMMKSGDWDCKLYTLTPTEARNLAFGSGGLEKHEIYDILKDQYDFSEFEKGGNDETDAVCIGLAAEEIERDPTKAPKKSRTSRRRKRAPVGVSKKVTRRRKVRRKPKGSRKTS